MFDLFWVSVFIIINFKNMFVWYRLRILVIRGSKDKHSEGNLILYSLSKIIVVSYSLGIIFSMTSLEISSCWALTYQISSPLSGKPEINYKFVGCLLSIHITTAPLGLSRQITVIGTHRVYIYKSMTFLPQHPTLYLTALWNLTRNQS